MHTLILLALLACRQDKGDDSGDSGESDDTADSGDSGGECPVCPGHREQQDGPRPSAHRGPGTPPAQPAQRAGTTAR